MTTETQSRPDFWTRLGRTIGRLLGFLLRLIFVILLAIALGVGVYYGAPWVYSSLIQPVQTHTNQISLLTNRLDSLRASVDQAQTVQDDRLTALETHGDEQRERLAAAETAVADLKNALAEEASAREELASQLAALQTEMDTQSVEAAALRDTLADLQPAARAAAANVASLQRQMALSRTQNLLLKARVQFVAENVGEARLLLTQSAGDLQTLVETLDLLPADTQAALAVRLIAARALIETQPADALVELESIWAQLDRTVSVEG